MKGMEFYRANEEKLSGKKIILVLQAGLAVRPSVNKSVLLDLIFLWYNSAERKNFI